MTITTIKNYYCPKNNIEFEYKHILESFVHRLDAVRALNTYSKIQLIAFNIK